VSSCVLFRKYSAVHIFSHQIKRPLSELIQHLARVCLSCVLIIENIISLRQIVADTIETFHIHRFVRLFALQKSRHLRIAPQHRQSTKSQKEHNSNNPRLTAAFRSYIQRPTPPLNISDSSDRSQSSL